MKIRGRAFVLPQALFDDVNTDVILAGPYLRAPEDELGDHAFQGVMPDFPEKVRDRPILVGGANFGCGSSREQAPKALIGCGVRLVIASSFGHIFFRNAINLGLPALVCPDPERLRALDGDPLAVDMLTGQVRLDGDPAPDAGEIMRGRPLSAHLLSILQAGGILPLLARQGGALTPAQPAEAPA